MTVQNVQGTWSKTQLKITDVDKVLCSYEDVIVIGQTTQ